MKSEGGEVCLICFFLSSLFLSKRMSFSTWKVPAFSPSFSLFFLSFFLLCFFQRFGLFLFSDVIVIVNDEYQLACKCIPFSTR
jgi:hypothetical protein